jgi:hydrogenase-4 component E
MITQLLTAAILLLTLQMLGSARLGVLIRSVALQAGAMILLGIFSAHELPNWHEGLLLLTTFLLKCLVFPLLLRRALRETVIHREVEPLIGYTRSLFIGLVLLGAGLWIATRLPLPPKTINPFQLAIALATIGSGFILIVGRVKAITQTIGYLVLENGIGMLGFVLATGSPLIIEMGILLDIFVGIFVMGILMLDINREFDHMDTDKLSTLRDL